MFYIRSKKPKKRYQLISGDQTTNNKMKSFIAAAAVLATAAAAPAGPPAPYAPPPAPYHPAPVKHAAPYQEPAPKPYAFEYGVEDSYSGAAFGQTETSDTKLVTGNYRVALPDGRTQIVTYTSDPYGYGGHVADVKYEGVAHFPEHKPGYKPAPHPVPVHPAPIHG